MSHQTRQAGSETTNLTYRNTKSARRHQMRMARLEARARKYGVSSDDLLLRLYDQKERCAICGDKFARTRRFENEDEEVRFFVDHDHQTGAVRGLLCTPCNTGLGLFRDRPALLRRAAEYIEVAK